MIKHIHALLVGINNYNHIRKLAGCVDDIEKITRYLTRLTAPCKIETLLNEQATKGAIVDAFIRHAQTINPDDTFFFYFSGHGTQEDADPIWNEANKSLECIVCYDEEPAKHSGYLLADKELRYLIYHLAKTGCHIVTIFDCCHSGSNTRTHNFELVCMAYNGKDVKERRYAHHFPVRPWNEFIFSDAVRRDEALGKPVKLFLPQGAHVQIAACESDESALEVNGSGVFTQTLLHVLQDCGSNISYYTLRSRVRQYLRFGYRQQPRMYAVGATDEETRQLLFSQFLNRDTPDKLSLTAEAVYNRKKGWLLNLGVIHGVDQSTVVDLIDFHTTDKRYRFSVQAVYIDHALLKSAENVQLPAVTVLQASVQGIALHELKLHLKAYDSDIKVSKQIADALSSQAAGHFILTEDEAEAQYTLHAWHYCLYITHAQEQFRPLIQPIGVGQLGESLSGIRQMIGYLKHLSQWTLIQQLCNQATSRIDNKMIEVQITQVQDDGIEKVILIDNGNGIAKLEPFLKSSLYIRLTNTSEQKIFVAVAYLSYNFCIFTDLLEGKTELLQPKSSTSLRLRSREDDVTKKDHISLQLPDVVQEYNWAGYTETLKIIISTEEFSHEALNLDPLPSPYVLNDRNKKRSSVTRTFDFEEDPPVLLSTWTTQTIALVYPNIFFNNVEKSKIDEMKVWDKTAFFAEGLY